MKLTTTADIDFQQSTDGTLDMTTKTKPFDPAKYLNTAEDHADLLSDAFDSGQPAYIAAALGVVARAHGMTKLATDTDITRQALHKALSEKGNPRLDTIIKVMDALGLHIRVERRELEAA